MRKRLVLIALAVAVASVMVFGGPASAGKPGTRTLREAELTGAEVVPGPGDPDGSGMGRFHFYPMKNKICYRVTVSGIQTATKAHLHMGEAGEEGGMVKLNLLPPRNSARECVRGLGERFIKIDRAQLFELLRGRPQQRIPGWRLERPAHEVNRR